MGQSTFTTNGPHGMEAGDYMRIVRGGRWSEIWRTLKRPRIQIVEAVSPTTFDIVERRMTWSEWRASLWSALRG